MSFGIGQREGIKLDDATAKYRHGWTHENQYLGIEHLLLGLVAKNHGLAADLLRAAWRSVGAAPAHRQRVEERCPHLRPPV